MCYLVRKEALQADHGVASPAPGSGSVRPRWAGAAVATLIGGFALAALVAPSPTAPLVPPRQEAAAPVTTRAANVPAGVTSEKVTLPADDGVPTGPDAVRAGIGPCHHDL